ETALTLRTVFRLALRQSEGLIGSIMKMLEIDLPVPDHTTLSRRAGGLAVCNLARIGTGKLHLIVASLSGFVPVDQEDGPGAEKFQEMRERHLVVGLE